MDNDRQNFDDSKPQRGGVLGFEGELTWKCEGCGTENRLSVDQPSSIIHCQCVGCGALSVGEMIIAPFDIDETEL